MAAAGFCFPTRLPHIFGLGMRAEQGSGWGQLSCPPMPIGSGFGWAAYPDRTPAAAGFAGIKAAAPACEPSCMPAVRSLAVNVKMTAPGLAARLLAVS